MRPKLIIHGGLGRSRKPDQSHELIQQSLRLIAEASFAFLQQHSATEAVVYANSLLEDEPLFNAGTGSCIQSDGVIRMAASVMNGQYQRFAGVINISHVKNPVQVAARLLPLPDRVLAGSEACKFARVEGFAEYNPETAERRKDYDHRAKEHYGTVGAVALDTQGRIAAATSTGGKGFEMPGRASDSATVAGNYANTYAGVSCTGTGEDIIDAALAARIVTRVTDGMSLQHACDLSIAELSSQGGHAGVIALDAQGNMHHAATKPYLTCASHDGRLQLFV